MANKSIPLEFPNSPRRALTVHTHRGPNSKDRIDARPLRAPRAPSALYARPGEGKDQSKHNDLGPCAHGVSPSAARWATSILALAPSTTPQGTRIGKASSPQWAASAVRVAKHGPVWRSCQ